MQRAIDDGVPSPPPFPPPHTFWCCFCYYILTLTLTQYHMHMTTACSVCVACVTCLALLPCEPLWAVTYHQVHTLSARPIVLTNINCTWLEVWRNQLGLHANEHCIHLHTNTCAWHMNPGCGILQLQKLCYVQFTLFGACVAKVPRSTAACVVGHTDTSTIGTRWVTDNCVTLYKTEQQA